MTSDLTGLPFHNWTVIRRVPNRFYKSGSRVYWLCKCNCGVEQEVAAQDLREGTSKRCRKCQGLDPRSSSFLSQRGAPSTNFLLQRSRRREPGASAGNALFLHYRAGAKVRGLAWELSKSAFFLLTQENCHYCGIPPSSIFRKPGANGDFLYNGVDRKDNQLGYLSSNCLPACSQCNRAKRNLEYSVFTEWLIRASVFLSNQALQKNQKL
jgi:hypothetical protein